ncbi:MAG: HTH-type transcriptional activator RhaR [Verrucomicrobiae bacterium]|nr:HTH-type transcriptional activator RhaR [Verrucomicrobiae bacterium]
MRRLATKPLIPLMRFRDGALNQPPFIHAGHGVFDGQPLAVHRHDFAEIAVALAGEAYHLENGRSCPLRPGDVIIITGDTAHGFLQPRKFEICNVAFRLRVLKPHQPWLGKIPGYAALFRPPPGRRKPGTIRQPLHLTPRDLGHVADLLRALEKECRSERSGYESMMTGLFLQLVTVLARACTPEQVTQGPNERVTAVIGHMEEHYAERLTLADLAKVTHASPSTLMRLFRQATGVSPVDYLIRTRIWKACEHLGNPTQSIKDIAFAVGFNDTNYFSRQFYRVMRTAPSKYRAEIHGPGAPRSPLHHR